jgi:glycosyltransferase involved in cell wall biosynthesis
MFGMSKYLLRLLTTFRVPVVFELADEGLVNNINYGWDDKWFTYWTEKPKNLISRILKLILQHYFKHFPGKKEIPFEFDPQTLVLTNGIFVSKDLMERYAARGVVFANSAVIYNGIPTKLFRNEKTRVFSGVVNMLYVGQVEKHKGVHTIIDAMVNLAEDPSLNFHLDIVGGTLDVGYQKSLKEKIMRYSLNKRIRFMGKVQRDLLPEIYNTHDIFIFPSIWKEPFGLTIIEAMACGTVVVGTATGGNKEYMLDGSNCLVFPPGDAVALTRQLKKLMLDPGLRKQLSENGARMAKERFDLEIMVRKKEEYLTTLVNQKRMQ